MFASCPNNATVYTLGSGSYGCVIRCSHKANKVVKLFIPRPSHGDDVYLWHQRQEVAVANKFAEAARADTRIADAISTIETHTKTYAVVPTKEAIGMCPALGRHVVSAAAITYTYAGAPLAHGVDKPIDDFTCVLQYLERLARGLRELNARHLTHGDITKFNVMRHPKRGYVLVDFGFDFPADATQFLQFYKEVDLHKPKSGWALWRPWQLYLLTRPGDVGGVTPVMEFFWKQMQAQFKGVLPDTDTFSDFVENHWTAIDGKDRAALFTAWFERHEIDAYSIAALCLFVATDNNTRHPLAVPVRWAVRHIGPLMASPAPVTYDALQAAFDAGHTMARSMPAPMAVATISAGTAVEQIFCSADDADAYMAQWALVDATLRPATAKVVHGPIAGVFRGGVTTSAKIVMADVSFTAPPRLNNVARFLRAVDVAAAAGIFIHCYEDRCIGFLEDGTPVLVNACVSHGSLPKYDERIAAGDLFLPLCCHLARGDHHVRAVATELWQRIQVMLNETVEEVALSAIDELSESAPDASALLPFASLYGVVLHLLPYMEPRHKRAVALRCLASPYFTWEEAVAALA